MNSDRMDAIASDPASASRQEIAELAALAKLEEIRRHKLWAILTIARPLTPSVNRGGAMAKVTELATEGLKDLPLAT